MTKTKLRTKIKKKIRFKIIFKPRLNHEKKQQFQNGKNKVKDPNKKKYDSK